MQYCQQNNNGSPGTVFPAGWNQQKNIAAGPSTVIAGT